MRIVCPLSLVIFGFALGLGHRSAEADRPFAPPAGGVSLVLLDNRDRDQIRDAFELIENQEYDQPLRYLQGLLDRDDDRFWDHDDDPKTPPVSLRGSLTTKLRSLPPRGRTVYATLTDAQIQGLLETVRTEGDLSALTEVVRRFAANDNAAVGIYQLGVIDGDRGDHLAAVRSFRFLKQSGQLDRFEPWGSLRLALGLSRLGDAAGVERVLARLSEQTPGPIRIGGEEVTIPEQNQRDWLASIFGRRRADQPTSEENWLLARGSARRWTHRAADKPSLPQTESIPWVAELVNDPFRPRTDRKAGPQDESLRDLVDSLWKGRGTAMLSPSPLVVGDLVLVRTLGQVTAFDLSTGNPVWRTVRETSFSELVRPEATIAGQEQLLKSLVSRRLFGQLTHGHMAADSQRLYTVEETGLGAVRFGRPFPPQPGGGQAGVPSVVTPATNTLVAYHLTNPERVGQRLWTVGGPANDPLYELPLSGVYFLGAPLPMGGDLFVLGERSGEVRLFALDPATGSERWSVPLFAVDQTVDRHPHRRHAGSTLLAVGRTLFCTIDSGPVMAFDPKTARLLWMTGAESVAGRGRNQNGNDDQPAGEPEPEPILLPQPIPFPGPIPKPGPGPRPIPQPGPQAGAWNIGWVDQTPLFADGVLIVPHSRFSGWNVTESILVAIDTTDGSVLWTQSKTERKNAGWLGDLDGSERDPIGVVNGELWVAGTTHIRAFDLRSGKPIEGSRIATGTPTGRGLLVDGQLGLPLEGGTVLPIDLASRTAGQPIVPQNAIELGNLVTVRGLLISQGPRKLTVSPLPGPLRE